MHNRSLGLILVVLVFVLALMAPIVGCEGADNEEADNASDDTTQQAEETSADEEASGDAASSVLLRVSGTPGTAYSGGYGTIEETQAIQDALLGAQPVDYEEVKIRGDEELAAVFRKTRPGDAGTLKVEFLVEGEVVAENETSENLGVVNVNWSPQEGQKGRVGPLD